MKSVVRALSSTTKQLFLKGTTMWSEMGVHVFLYKEHLYKELKAENSQKIKEL